MPLSNFLTLRTSSACSWGVRFLWITPMPPAWAMAMASLLSVTVSMAADNSGMPSSMERVRRVLMSVWLGRTADSRRLKQDVVESKRFADLHANLT